LESETALNTAAFTDLLRGFEVAAIDWARQ